jgi:hypothetical protein
MTTYARIRDGVFDSLHDLSAEQYNALVANGKAAHLRLWIVDPEPVDIAPQVFHQGPIVITATEARQTWVIRDKTPAELDRDSNATDLPQLKQLVTELTSDIQAYNANPDTNGTAAERLTKLESRQKESERQTRRNNRILRYYLRSLS